MVEMLLKICTIICVVSENSLFCGQANFVHFIAHFLFMREFLLCIMYESATIRKQPKGKKKSILVSWSSK